MTREAVIKSAASAASPEGREAVIKSAASAASPAAQKNREKIKETAFWALYIGIPVVEGAEETAVDPGGRPDH